ncbi:MAG: polysaccharide pyruvyl transferase family protein, partial [Desulfobulbaceae bacterium]|nr:polysaccharide pyruvyl transferase family protein [Desulfobulbaceae bacterium]
QTVDVKDNLQGQEVLAKVYSMLDYVAAREPVSERELVSLGIDAKLIPDAAYALPRLSAEQIELHTKNMNLPPKFIGVTGSSALKKSSVDMMGFVLKLIKEHYRLPIVFLANAKTDIALAKALKDKYGLLVVQPPVKYQQAMAVIAKAHLVIGGRQHPNIFAAMHHVPFIPFAGNTHKMNGVIELLGYPTQVIPWEKNRKRILKAFTTTDQLYDNLCRIEAPQPIRVQLVPRL